MSSVVSHNSRKINGMHRITLKDNATRFYSQALLKDYRLRLGDTSMRETPEFESTPLWGRVQSEHHHDRRNQQRLVDTYSSNHQAINEMGNTTNQELFPQRTTAPLRRRFS